jgi:hypothetical protein
MACQSKLTQQTATPECPRWPGHGRSFGVRRPNACPASGWTVPRQIILWRDDSPPARSRKDRASPADSSATPSQLQPTRPICPRRKDLVMTTIRDDRADLFSKLESPGTEGSVTHCWLNGCHPSGLADVSACLHGASSPSNPQVPDPRGPAVAGVASISRGWRRWCPDGREVCRWPGP